MAMAMHRQLQASRLLVFLDFAPPDGSYSWWNGGNPITISRCNLPQSEIDQAVAGTVEDFAPFNIEVGVGMSASCKGVYRVHPFHSFIHSSLLFLLL